MPKFSPKGQEQPAQSDKIGPRAQNHRWKEEQTELPPARIQGQKQQRRRDGQAKQQVTEGGQAGKLPPRAPQGVIEQAEDGAQSAGCAELRGLQGYGKFDHPMRREKKPPFLVSSS